MFLAYITVVLVKMNVQSDEEDYSKEDTHSKVLPGKVCTEQ